MNDVKDRVFVRRRVEGMIFYFVLDEIGESYRGHSEVKSLQTIGYRRKKVKVE